jgi:tyrosyl-tRNA synthetase
MDTVLNDIENVVGKPKSFNRKLKNGEFNIYWGTKIYDYLDIKIVFVINKIVDLLKLGHNIIILVADIHTILDTKNKYVEKNSDLFIDNLFTLIKSYNLSEEQVNKIKIIKGSQFQLSSNYMLDMIKLISIYGSIKDYCDNFELDINSITFNDVLHPILQSLDEEHLKEINGCEIDCQIGYSINIKQHVFAKKNMPKLGYKSRTYLLYNIPENFIKTPIYFKTTNFVSIMNTLSGDSLSFMMDTLFEMIKLKINKLYSDEEICEKQKIFNKMTREAKCDTTIQLINELF